MEDVGNNYFKILLQRSFLQEAEFNENGNIISCKMHDLVHDFALETSKGRCLIAKAGELSDDIKAVHLTIVRDGSDNFIISEKNLSKLRTLHFTHHFSSKNFLAHCKCENLRVLTLVDRELPISIAKMKHLRYLDISRSPIRALPEFISKLYNLQTLRLPFVVNFQKDFVRLVNLRHLFVQIEFSRYPLIPGIGQLMSLRTLSCFGVSRDKGCQIEELCSLNHLEGSLRVIGLENVANGDDASRANLSGKRNIQSLELFWSRNNTEETSNDESILECLQPHPYLKALTIEKFNGRSLPSWIPLLHNLMSLKLENLRNCEQIPPLGHLPFLKFLLIRNMTSVKCVGNDFYGWPNPNLVSADSSQTSAVVLFPSLKKLRFAHMPSLEEWSDMVQPSFVSSSSSVELFPSLEMLRIFLCPVLTRVPDSLLSASTDVDTLLIGRCPNLVSIPNLSSLLSLRDLTISDCPKLSGLPHGIKACRSLQSLTITCRASVMESLPHYLINLKRMYITLSSNIIEPISNTTKDGIQGHHEDPFSILEDLTLRGKPQFKSLPEQILHFTALRYLRLAGFEGLETLPEWLGNFHSLEVLSLFHCHSLVNFPSAEVIRGLTNLKSLYTYDCPILEQRCERETGAEWHKIAHIPRISLHRRLQ